MTDEKILPEAEDAVAEVLVKEGPMAELMKTAGIIAEFYTKSISPDINVYPVIINFYLKILVR